MQPQFLVGVKTGSARPLWEGLATVLPASPISRPWVATLYTPGSRRSTETTFPTMAPGVGALMWSACLGTLLSASLHILARLRTVNSKVLREY
jgi:hypothetical protein